MDGQEHHFEKRGQGECRVDIAADGSVIASINGGGERKFPTAQEAHDHFAALAGGDHAAWNAAYFLEDHL